MRVNLENFPHQYDDGEAAAIVHAISHTLADVNLADLAADQPPIDEESPSSLQQFGSWEWMFR